jgi:hypothetical protein
MMKPQSCGAWPAQQLCEAAGLPMTCASLLLRAPPAAALDLAAVQPAEAP